MASPVKSEAQRLLDKLYQIQQDSREQVPPNFYNTKYWAKQWGKSISRTRDYLRIAVKNKLMEVRYFMVADGKTARKCAYFKLIK